MGLPPYPTPADGGMLCVILVNTAISFSIVRDIVLSILHVVGIRISSLEEYSIESPSDFCDCRGSPSETYMEEFRSRTPSVRFKTMCDKGQRRPERDCSVCLTEFEPDAEINHLPCGHLFHKMCLEKWLRCWNVTCPLCRTRMVPQEEEEETAPIYLVIFFLILSLRGHGVKCTAPLLECGFPLIMHVAYRARSSLQILGGLLSISESLEPAVANSESLEPTDMTLRVRPGFRWYRQRNDPAWVVGEQRQLYFTHDDFRRAATGDVGDEDTNAELFTSSRFIGGRTIFRFATDSAIVALRFKL
ncbi:RING-type E3 ubiquitin transferase [Sarracenia purpurea var. burkii]